MFLAMKDSVGVIMYHCIPSIFRNTKFNVCIFRFFQIWTVSRRITFAISNFTALGMSTNTLLFLKM